MAEALRRAIATPSRAWGCTGSWSSYLPTHERSGRLLRRLGFTVEGYARDYLLLDGEWRDHILTSLVSTSGAQG